MKYKKEVYEEIDLFAGDMDSEYEDVSQKIVKARKPHKCMDCETEIPVGDNALSLTSIGEEGFVTIYSCIPCLDKWLEELEEHGEEFEKEVEE